MTEQRLLTPDEFEAALRAKGAFYHIHHPYHIAMHNGEATRGAAWAFTPI
ncbi:Coenzyme PQQ synthesis protein C [Cronobacter universalis NCTC 9529]|nr:Coenzyme PQQ synthesis protein C [Cronobacter universalis NCTC 9529]